MIKLYRLQARRLALLRRYAAIVTHSDHMLREYLKHGLPAHRAYNFQYYVAAAGEQHPPAMEAAVPHHDDVAAGRRLAAKLIYSGRMERLKGGRVLIEALPEIAARLRRPVSMTFAGAGSDRAVWERDAARIRRRHPEIAIEFLGWIPPGDLQAILDACDLLIVPSLWPEPFGLIGPEAGLRCLPSAAFAVGGIRDWLIDGVNGYLAPGNPPTAHGLAEAVARCLHDPAVHARLRRGAVEVARRFNLTSHITALLQVFAEVVERGGAVGTQDLAGIR
jgi:glycosyltransferase involved in cell wall biosynthesis